MGSRSSKEMVVAVHRCSAADLERRSRRVLGGGIERALWLAEEALRGEREEPRVKPGFLAWGGAPTEKGGHPGGGGDTGEFVLGPRVGLYQLMRNTSLRPKQEVKIWLLVKKWPLKPQVWRRKLKHLRAQACKGWRVAEESC